MRVYQEYKRNIKKYSTQCFMYQNSKKYVQNCYRKKKIFSRNYLMKRKVVFPFFQTTFIRFSTLFSIYFVKVVGLFWNFVLEGNFFTFFFTAALHWCSFLVKTFLNFKENCNFFKKQDRDEFKEIYCWCNFLAWESLKDVLNSLKGFAWRILN